MGEEKRDSLRVKFDRQVKLEFHGTRVTSDAGLLAYHELAPELGLTQMAEVAVPQALFGEIIERIRNRSGVTRVT